MTVFFFLITAYPKIVPELSIPDILILAKLLDIKEKNKISWPWTPGQID